MGGTIYIDLDYRTAIESVNGTPQQIAGFAIPENGIGYADLRIKSISPDDGSSAAWMIVGMAKRVNGDAILTGGSWVIKGTARDAAADITRDLIAAVSGEYVIITATGDATKRVWWYVSGSFETERMNP